MGRQPRVWYPGATYHVTSRGNRRSAVFFDSEDRMMYLDLLEETKYEFPFKLHAYCLMTNHIHLLIETEKAHIKKIMKRLHSLYAIYFNHRHDLCGHLFQGRYGARVVKNTTYFLEVSKYIHLNPYMASIVAEPEDYWWSSYKEYLSHSPSPLLTTDRVLSYFPSRDPELYKQFVELDMREEAALDDHLEFYNLYLHYLSKYATANLPSWEDYDRGKSKTALIAEMKETMHFKEETPAPRR
ncbi:transposase [Salipaludibacillus aurantiacus]|uniref:REP element-mobilizing transposase RayT n=1 Tax=Salipaludibacillus aurantiacus TaxID=1601833 RepID=A0A1H9W949_9BACI|nr:transposase [Salipaludibacillus aurantiacus]SES30375.1 REP element-mobilizing transposase RayT [Salipaludibacillus aurantiacus]